MSPLLLELISYKHKLIFPNCNINKCFTLFDSFLLFARKYMCIVVFITVMHLFFRMYLITLELVGV